MKTIKNILISLAFLSGSFGAHAGEFDQSLLFTGKQKSIQTKNAELFDAAVKIADRITSALQPDKERVAECSHNRTPGAQLRGYEFRSSMPEITRTDWLFGLVDDSEELGIQIAGSTLTSIEEIEKTLRNNISYSNRVYPQSGLPMPIREINAYISRKLAEVQTGVQKQAHQEKYEYKIIFEEVPCMGHTYKLKIVEIINGVEGKSFLLLQEHLNYGLYFLDGEKIINTLYFETQESEADGERAAKATYKGHGIDEQEMEFLGFKNKFLFPHFQELMAKHFGVEFELPTKDTQALPEAQKSKSWFWFL